MKWVLIVLGAILFLLGAVWVLQGTNVLTQSVMSGQSRWTVIGAILGVVGVVVFVWGLTRRRMKRA
jgi:multisubunit Na+/H+ antiporter MnhG subunit